MAQLFREIRPVVQARGYHSSIRRSTRLTRPPLRVVARRTLGACDARAGGDEFEGVGQRLAASSGRPAAHSRLKHGSGYQRCRARQGQQHHLHHQFTRCVLRARVCVRVDACVRAWVCMSALCACPRAGTRPRTAARWLKARGLRELFARRGFTRRSRCLVLARAIDEAPTCVRVSCECASPRSRGRRFLARLGRPTATCYAVRMLPHVLPRRPRAPAIVPIDILISIFHFAGATVVSWRVNNQEQLFVRWVHKIRVTTLWQANRRFSPRDFLSESNAIPSSAYCFLI